MSDEIQVYEPPSDDNKPNWGVIILTGITALVVVVGIGILSQQVSHWWNNLDAEPTATPHSSNQTTTLGAAAQVYAVPHHGAWEIRARVAYLDGEVITFSSSGTGSRIEPPQYEIPEGGSVITEEIYRIVVTYPNLNASPLTTETETLLRDNPDVFRAALRQNYYALYDGSNRFISIISQTVYATDYSDLPLEYWGVVPPQTPIPATP